MQPVVVPTEGEARDLAHDGKWEDGRVRLHERIPPSGIDSLPAFARLPPA